MTFISDRMGDIDASGIRKAFALAAKLENPINLSIGQPDYDVDAPVKDAAIKAIEQGHNSYTQTWGIDALREACAAYYQRRYAATLENVMITSGVSGGLFLALLATVNPGDEVLFGDPYFVMYKHLVSLLGGVPVPIDTYPSFILSAEAVDAAITPRSKLLIVNSPSNPTGVSLSSEQMESLAAIAAKHNLLVLSDEIYEGMHYDGPPASMAGRYENTLILNGFSKIAGMTGWRVGYAAGPEDIIQQMNTLQQYTFVCAPSFAQHAAVTALTIDHSEKIAAYEKRRDLIHDALKDHFAVIRPNGAFYIFPEAPGLDGEAFVAKALEHNVILIPGSVFSEKNTHFRISFAASEENLLKGAATLNRLAAQGR